MRKKSRMELKIWIFAMIAGVLCINISLDFFYYKNYEDKMTILSEIIQNDGESNLDTVINILKQKNPEPVDGREQLLSLGYFGRGQNTFGRQFVTACIITAAVSLVVLLFFIFCMWKQKRNLRKEEDHLLFQLEQSLQKFRDSWKTEVEITGDRESVPRINEQLKSLQDYLQMIREQAKEEKEATKSLVTDLSHQLKTPVAALDTCLTILMDPSILEEERQEFMLRCRNELDGLKLLLQSLIQISRMEAGMIEIKTKKLPLLPTILNAVNRIYPKASEKEIDISFDYDDELEQLAIMQDAKWLCEAIINVLDNAVKYSGHGTEINLSIQRRTTFVRIEIRDQGIGIPKSDYHKIFQRFYRGALEQVTEENGSGVGLYLVRQIIQKHHGMVSVASGYEKQKKENPGSTFVIQLPSYE